MANSNVVNKKLQRNTLLTRFLTSNLGDWGVRRDGDDDDPAADVSDNDDNNDDATAADPSDDDTGAGDPDDDANVSIGFDDDGDGADEDADAPAVDIAFDDAADDDPDADITAGFDDEGDSVDKYTDAPADNTAADCECDGDDGNGEGKIDGKGDCDSDYNRAECWRKFKSQHKSWHYGRAQRILKEHIFYLFLLILETFS